MEAREVHAIRCSVPADAMELVRRDRFEYADAFAVTLPAGIRATAEEWARLMFTPRGVVFGAFAAAWNAVMRMDPPPSGSALGPFELVSAGPKSVVLVGNGDRYRVRLVVLAREGSLVFATFVQSQGRAWHELGRGILVGHRRVAPLLLERALAAKTRKLAVVHP